MTTWGTWDHESSIQVVEKAASSCILVINRVERGLQHAAVVLLNVCTRQVSMLWGYIGEEHAQLLQWVTNTVTLRHEQFTAANRWNNKSLHSFAQTTLQHPIKKTAVWTKVQTAFFFIFSLLGDYWPIPSPPWTRFPVAFKPHNLVPLLCTYSIHKSKKRCSESQNKRVSASGIAWKRYMYI